LSPLTIKEIEIAVRTDKTGKLSDRAVLQCARTLLVENGLLAGSEAATFVMEEHCLPISSDGSTRRFWRLMRKGQSCCLVVAPAGVSHEELAESRSAWKIGRHLREKGIPVPEIYGWDSNTGVLLFEDLGDMRLHDLITSATNKQTLLDDRVAASYHAALENLVAMQCQGTEGFDGSWCWDGQQYDHQLMVEREAGYFLRSFWTGLLGHEVDDRVWPELYEIARLAGEAPANFFLHRDFQSRNIMLKDGFVRFIDFQGGRLGPLGYDLASLLIDPYSSLPLDIQDDLLELYLRLIRNYFAVDEALFKRHYALLAFQRNMQIVGAFSFLYKVRQKLFFMDFIKPSLLSLNNRVDDPLFKDFPLIREIIKRGSRELAAV
jgi:aminoglycoside/choline kinase family phosphotransferase